MPDQANTVGQFNVPSSATVPWGSDPAQMHVPQYTPVARLVASLPDASSYLHTVQNLFHPQAPTALPFNSEQLRGQSIIANSTAGARVLFNSILQVFHSPQGPGTIGNP